MGTSDVGFLFEPGSVCGGGTSDVDLYPCCGVLRSLLPSSRRRRALWEDEDGENNH